MSGESLGVVTAPEGGCRCVPAAQAMHPRIAGGLLCQPGQQLQGTLLHGHQPLQPGQAEHIPFAVTMATGRPRPART